jgi:anaerobic selenocysteine-containing dehydrogenase
VANWTPAPVAADIPPEWQTLLRLASAALGQDGERADVEVLDDLVAGDLARRTGLDLGAVAGRRGPARLVDLMLRAGPYDLTLADLEAAPHGIDLGPLQSRLPDALRTASGKIELAPEPAVADVERLRDSLQNHRNGGLVLVGRRHLRSNNSWMHNLDVLVKGKPRCTLHVHPDDAARHALSDGESAELRSRTGSVVAQVEVTDAIMPGVVSLPHGWGHDVDGTVQRVASAHPGTNSNLVADELLVDALSGNAVLNGIPVELVPVRQPTPV